MASSDFAAFSSMPKHSQRMGSVIVFIVYDYTIKKAGFYTENLNQAKKRNGMFVTYSF